MLGAGFGSGGASMRLGFSISLKDNFSGPAQNIKNTLDGLKSEYSAYRGNLSALRDTTVAVAAAGFGISMSLYQAAMEGAEFLHTMQGVLAISEATNSEFRILKDLAVSLGRETIFTPDQVASGMRFMAMAGQTAGQIQATARDATYLAAATMTPLGGKLGAADILTNALKGFGLQVDASTQMSDMLTYATTSANVSLQDLGNSIRYVASTSKNLNIPIQDTIGFVMALGNAGIQSSMAGTALENMYRYLAMSISDFATKRQKAAWQTIGLDRADITTAEGSFKPMVEVLGMIKERIEQLGAVDKQNILKEIFGVRGQRAAGTILRNLGEASGFINKLNDPGISGTAAGKSALMMDTLKGSALKLTSAIDGLKAAWAEALGGAFLSTFLVGLSKIFGWATELLKIPFIGTMAAILAGVIALGTGFAALGAVMFTIALTIDGIRTKWAWMMTAGELAIARLTGAAVAGNAAMAASMRMSFVGAGVAATAPFAISAGTAGLAAGAAGGGILASLGRWIPRIGKLLFSALGGWWGIGIMALVAGIPWIVGALNGNTEAIKENSNLMKASIYDPKADELMAILGGQTHMGTFSNLTQNMKKLVDEGKLTREEITKLLSTSEGQLQVLRLGVDNITMATLAPLVNPALRTTSGQNSKPK